MRPVFALGSLLILFLMSESTFGQSAELGLPKAYSRAQQLVPGGYLVRARVETFGGGKRYGFYFWYMDALYEIEIKTDGSVAKNKKVEAIPGGGTVGEPGATDEEDETIDPKILDAIKNRKRAKIPFSLFLDLATDAAKGGQPSKVQATLDKNKNVQFQVDVTRDGKTLKVFIDPTTNKVVNTSR